MSALAVVLAVVAAVLVVVLIVVCLRIAALDGKSEQLRLPAHEKRPPSLLELFGVGKLWDGNGYAPTPTPVLAVRHVAVLQDAERHS